MIITVAVVRGHRGNGGGGGGSGSGVGGVEVAAPISDKGRGNKSQ